MISLSPVPKTIVRRIIGFGICGLIAELPLKCCCGFGGEREREGGRQREREHAEMRERSASRYRLTDGERRLTKRGRYQ